MCELGWFLQIDFFLGGGGGNAKGHNYPQVHGSGCPKEMSNSEIISDGFSEFEELCVAFARCRGFVRKQPCIQL